MLGRTIKPSDAINPIGIRRSPSRRFVTSNTTLKMLIAWTHDIRDERLAGAPGWLDSARLIPHGSNMMKSLLAERFKLRVSTETNDLPALECLLSM